MLDYRMHHAIMVAEERTESLRRRRTQLRLLREGRPQPEPRPQRRRRWSLAGFVLRLNSARGTE